MLILKISLANNSFGIDVNEIIEVIPWVNCQKINFAPKYVLGIINYRDQLVPVIDLVHLLNEVSATNKISSRIIITKYEFEQKDYLVGMLAENIVETEFVDESTLISNNLNFKNIKFLGAYAKNDDSYLQILILKQIIDKSLKKYFSGL